MISIKARADLRCIVKFNHRAYADHRHVLRSFPGQPGPDQSYNRLIPRVAKLQLETYVALGVC